jgi:hypothetical protein
MLLRACITRCWSGGTRKRTKKRIAKRLVKSMREDT